MIYWLEAKCFSNTILKIYIKASLKVDKTFMELPKLIIYEMEVNDNSRKKNETACNIVVESNTILQS